MVGVHDSDNGGDGRGGDVTEGGDAGALTAVAARFDALVDATSGIDRFCSATDWIVPLHRCFGSGRVVLETGDDTGDGGAAAVALATLPGTGGRILCGLDPLWGYACPVVGPDAEAGAVLVERVLRRRPGGALAVALTSKVKIGRAHV